MLGVLMPADDVASTALHAHTVGVSVKPVQPAAGPSSQPSSSTLPPEQRVQQQQQQLVTLEVSKQTKCRCGLEIVQEKKSLIIRAVQPGSIGADAGFRAGDELISIGDLSVKEDRVSKHKANGVLFDVKGTCVVTVMRGSAGPSATSSTKTAAAPDTSSASAATIQRPAVPVHLDSKRSTSTSSSSVDERPTGQQPVSVAEAIRIAEAKVAAAMAKAAAEARAAAASKAAAEARVAEQARVKAAEAAAKAAKAAEAAAAKRRAAEEAAEAERRAAAAAAAANSTSSGAAGGSSQGGEAGSSSSSSGAAPAAAASSSKSFVLGDAVLYDNTRTGAMELATVVAVHAEASPPAYTVSVGGHEMRTDGTRLTRCRNQAATPAGGASAGAGLAQIPAFRPKAKPRLGAGNPKGVAVPGLPLKAHGIGVAPKVPVRTHVAGGGNAFGWKPYGAM
jgi:hypothetical protein